MRRVMMLAIGFGVLSAACGPRYHRGYYGGAYYGGAAPVEGQVTVQTPPPPQGGVQVQVQQPTVVVAGEGIAGSDGTRGWRVGSQAPQQDFQRLAQALARANCQVEGGTSQGEVHVMCNGNVHLMLRFDQQNIYKLCGPNTDPNMCSQTWGTIGN